MPAMSDAEIRTALTSLPAWNVVGGELTRQFRFRDFVEAFGFMAQVAVVQEQLDHNATITNTWADVRLAVSTHSEGGITAKDFELARRVDERATNAR